MELKLRYPKNKERIFIFYNFSSKTISQENQESKNNEYQQYSRFLLIFAEI